MLQNRRMKLYKELHTLFVSVVMAILWIFDASKIFKDYVDNNFRWVEFY